MTSRILRGDVLSFARHWKGGRFHALLCDPPYELGFMNKKWDRKGIAFRPETWSAFSDLLYPGAFGMAFASSRGWHRLAVAIEDAGYIIHPSIFIWAYGSGFPKATRIKDNEVFKGHRYGLQAIKPSAEPVIVFQKPYDGKPIDSIVKYGSGALNVDGGRIGTDESLSGRAYAQNGTERDDGWGMQRLGGAGKYEQPSGRWPANFTLSHSHLCDESDEGIWDCVEDCPVRLLGEQSGESKSVRADRGKGIDGATFKHSSGELHGIRGIDDSGTAARFFHNSDWNLETYELLNSTNPVMYQSKASRAERDAGLDNHPKVIRNDGRNESLASGDMPQNRSNNPHRNHHPTVKPISLNRWLATLLLPPDTYSPRRILIPFAGAASEMIGADMAGWEDIIGVEGEAEYVEIAKARLQFWREHKDEFTKTGKVPKLRKAKKNSLDEV